MVEIYGDGLLKKNATYTYIPGKPGRPANPGRPATPGYWERWEEQVCLIAPNNEASVIASLIAMSKAAGTVVSVEYKPGGLVCTMVEAKRWIPGKAAIPPDPGEPARPAQLFSELNVGWNSRAESIPALPQGVDGEYRATIPSGTTGAILGFTRKPERAGYNDIEVGLYVHAGSANLVLNGQMGVGVGQAGNKELIFRKTAGRVELWIGDERVYHAPIEDIKWSLGVALYTGGDAVMFPAYIERNSVGIQAETPSFAGHFGDDDYSALISYTAGFTGFFAEDEIAKLAGTAPGLDGFFSEYANYLAAETSGFSGWFEQTAIAPNFATLFGSTPMLQGMFVGNDGGLVRVTAETPAPRALFSELDEVAVLDGFTPGFSAWFSATYGPGEEFIVSVADSDGDMIAASELSVIMASNGTITGLLLTEVWTSALLDSLGTISGAIGTEAEIVALLQSLARTAVSLLPPDKTGDAWVFHEDANGMTRYTGFDFNSFAKIGGKYYGAKSDGIYLLEGKDDDGQSFESLVNFGNLSFGTLRRKLMPYVYVGMAASGDTFLRVTADEQTYTYRVRASSEHMKAHRYELGRGLRASFYEVELVADGELFDLQSIEFHPLEITRRL